MRTVVIRKQGNDLPALAKRLMRREANSATLLEELQTLNPHVDFAHLAPGTVLLVPDRADCNPTESDSVAGEVFAGLADDIRAGFKTASARIRSAYDRVDSDYKNVTAIARSATMKRIVDSDPELGKQLVSADARFKADVVRGREARIALGAMEKALTTELEELARLVP